MSSAAGEVAHESKRTINAGQKARSRAGEMEFFPEKGDDIAAVAASSRMNPPQCCACQRIGSTGSLSFHHGVVSTAPNAIFRQEFFEFLTKIKFRFFLVGFARGF
jgi:hypothetical protein